MFTSPWSRKGDGYELLDGSVLRSSHSCPSSRSSSPPQYYHELHNHDRCGERRRPSLACQAISIARRNKRRLIVTIIVVFCVASLQATLRVVFMPPAYVVLPPSSYVETLKATLKDRIPMQSESIRTAIQANIQALENLDRRKGLGYDTTGEASIPNKLFSSDQVAAPADWASMWKQQGFQPQFFNDEEADAWVEREWNGTQIVKAWKTMPRSILRADMLRYLLVFLEGGTWGDMDTVPLQHFSNWSRHTTTFDIYPHEQQHHPSPPAAIARQFIDKEHLITASSNETIQPIRAVVGIECSPQWLSLRGALELISLKPLNRHRNLQFVQWTIHFAPHHPIMVDVIRRILETTDIYKAYQIQMEREAQRRGWGWQEGVDMARPGLSLTQGTPLHREQNSRIPSFTAPWETIRQQWIWSKGHWRFGWHATSVEEWTGPAVWTDAIMSYIYYTTGIRPEELATITEPTQVGDLVILPEEGFNPPRWALWNPPSVSRSVHLFKGSWKKRVKSRLAD